MQETFGECDHLNIDGYYLLDKNESKKNIDNSKGRKSGGIIIYCKTYLKDYIHVYKKTDQFIWIEIKKEVFHNIEQNIRICAAYNPPSSSKYFNKDVIEIIGEHVIESGNNYPIILIGDINARVGNLADYMINDDNDLVPNILVSEIFHPKTERKNCDNQVNKEWIKLTEMCKSWWF